MENKQTPAPYTTIGIVTLDANCEFILGNAGANGCESDSGVLNNMDV
jgi:hypothetical protein